MSSSGKPIDTPYSNSLALDVRPVPVESLGLVEHKLSKVIDVLDCGKPLASRAELS